MNNQLQQNTEIMNKELKDKVFNSFHYPGKPIIKRLVCFRNRIFRYFTYNIDCKENPTTFKEIFIISKLYLNILIERYKNFTLQKTPITDSTFNISLSYSADERYDSFAYKTLYEIDIDNVSNEILYEFKNSFIENTKIKIFCFSVKIHVELYNYNKPFFYDGEKQPFIEDVCILCKKNKPNVLITKCQHLVICCVCDNYNNIEERPYCKRKPIYNYHKIKFSKINSLSMIDESTSTTDLTSITL